MTGPPMTLRNMRQNGVRSVDATCVGCGHEAVVNVDQLADEVFVPDVAKRLRCASCGSRKVTVRPNWREQTWPEGGPRMWRGGSR